MKGNWFTLSIGAFLLFSVMSFLITMLTRRGYSVAFVLFTIGIFVTVFYGIQAFIFSRNTVPVGIYTILIILLISILSTFANLFMYQAANNAPNPGLALAIGGLQAVGVSILALIFLKDKLSTIQIIGIILATVAVILIQAGGTSNARTMSTVDKTK